MTPAVSAAEPRLRIDVWADVVCPSCYVGDARLERAVALSPHADRIDVVLHTFELHPETPDEIQDNSRVLADMMGVSVAQADAGEERYAALAHAEGLPFAIRRGHRSTAPILRLLQLANTVGAGMRLMSTIQRATFGGDHAAFGDEFLVEAARGVGLDPEEARQALRGERFGREVAEDRETALRLGARGVPFTVLGGQLAIAGAASPDTYRDAIEQAWAVVSA